MSALSSVLKVDGSVPLGNFLTSLLYVSWSRNSLHYAVIYKLWSISELISNIGATSFHRDFRIVVE